MSDPRISVVMPVHNSEKFVAAAIESVLAQTMRDFEFIIVDDGSTDATPAIVNDYADPRIRVLFNPRNMGIPATRNRGVAAARAPLVAMIDSDDWAYPDRLARQTVFMMRHQDVALSGCWSRVVDETGRALGRTRRHPLSPRMVRARLLFRCCIGQRSIIARRAVLQNNPYCEAFPVSQDFELFVRLGAAHTLANIPAVLMAARTHSAQISRRRAALIKDRNIAVIQRQLEELGVAATPLDLERHYFLTRPGLLGTDLDPAFLEWAAEWLSILADANRHGRRYDPTALWLVSAEIWLNLSRHAARHHGWAAWRQFARSPLAASAALPRLGKIIRSCAVWARR